MEINFQNAQPCNYDNYFAPLRSSVRINKSRNLSVRRKVKEEKKLAVEMIIKRKIYDRQLKIGCPWDRSSFLPRMIALCKSRRRQSDLFHMQSIATSSREYIFPVLIHISPFYGAKRGSARLRKSVIRAMKGVLISAEETEESVSLAQQCEFFITFE